MNKRFELRLPRLILSALLTAVLLFTGCSGKTTTVTSTVTITDTVTVTADSKPSPAEKSGDTVILVTSDIHCGVYDGFGLDGLYAIREQLESKGDSVLLVDDGDSYQGEPIGTFSKGEDVVRLLNKMKYDVCIPGNHDFDFGMERFLELAEMAEYPIICCNFNKEGKLLFDPYIILESAGKKIAFIGVTTPNTITDSTPKNFQDEDGNYIYGFMADETGELLYSTIQKYIDEVRSKGADYVFLMGHLGINQGAYPYRSNDVVSNITGIDAILDGHTHDNEQMVYKDASGKDIPRLAPGTKLNTICYVRISKDGKITTGAYEWTNAINANDLLGINNELSGILEQAIEELSIKVNTPVAKTDYDLVIYDPSTSKRIVRKMESNLGDLCADAMRIQNNADIGIINGGGVRDNISKGDITYGDILSVHPFGNSACVIEATGQQIKDALEWGARAVPDENGGFLQVSGLTYEIDSTIPNSCTQDVSGMFTGVNGEYRVRNIMVGDKPIDLQKTYTIASTTYTLINNGDGFTMFNGCKVLENDIKLDYQILSDYITDDLSGTVGNKYADPYGEGRIKIIK
jgi:2',3'-cyclic-nucleotide 2'-phosphodiesterase (5'-nucleotidase family)